MSTESNAVLVPASADFNRGMKAGFLLGVLSTVLAEMIRLVWFVQ
jgi:hypothetical protein